MANIREVLNILKVNGVLPCSRELRDLSNFSDDMTISQVVRFFERRGAEFTKTMIQNYVRVGILPPPIEKRYYSREHLILLSLISDLKSVYSLEEIRTIVKPILGDIATPEDDKLDVMGIYGIYLKMYDESVGDFEKEFPRILEKVSKTVADSEVQENDAETVEYFMTILTLMVRSIAERRLVSALIDDYGKKHGVVRQ